MFNKKCYNISFAEELTMVFSSLTFLFVFLPTLILIYFLFPNIKYKNAVLLIFSIVFYSWGEPRYIVIMFISTVSGYFHALAIQNLKVKRHYRSAKATLVSSIVLNLALLGLFKYSDFIIGNLNDIFKADIKLLNILLPIGISFYTFQTMSYTIDVYFDKVKVQRNIFNLATYVMLFPQLIAGPIVRYETIENELESRKVTLDSFANGIRRFIIGLGKKIIIANQLAIIADTVFGLGKGEYGISLAWLGIIAYTLQIYFDFSGYSDMAIGLGKIFGFNFLENFNYPYISTSITDFWRRWHISLSSWFRDYVYIPLGGNRVSNVRWLVNILVVWFLTGLWHGANWTFVLWGLSFGLIIVLEKLVLLKYLEKLPRIFRHIYTIFLFTVGWIMFRSESIFQIRDYLTAMFGGYGNDSFSDINKLSILHLLPFMILAIIGATPLFKILHKKTDQKLTLSIIYDLFLAIVFIICNMYLISNSFNPFIYYRF